MRKFSLFLLLITLLLLAACDPTPAEPPASGQPPSAGPSGILTPSGIAPDPSLTLPTPSQVPPPVSGAPSTVPDLSKDWEDNGFGVTSLIFQKNYLSANGDVLLSANGEFPQTGVAGIDQYYAFCRDDFERLCGAMAGTVVSFSGPASVERGYTVECSAGGIFSVSRTGYAYSGGVHGEDSVWCETFSAASGAVLPLGAFFSVDQATYTERLLNEMYVYISRRSGELYESAGEILAAAFPYDAFVVTPDGLSFLFPPYALGPYSAGPVRIDIGWSAIHDIWKMPG